MKAVSLFRVPNNAYGYYNGNMSLPDAIEWSSNATAAQTMELIGGPSVAYQQVVTKMGFQNLTEQDAQNTGALSIGGMNGGVTVREMAAAYTYLGNGGLYYEPYTYYYVTDSEDNIIIDNRDAVPKQAYSAETAGIITDCFTTMLQTALTQTHITLRFQAGTLSAKQVQPMTIRIHGSADVHHMP